MPKGLTMTRLSLFALLALVIAVAIAAEVPKCPVDKEFTDRQCKGADEGLPCQTQANLPMCDCSGDHKCTKTKPEGGACIFMCKSAAFRESVKDDLKKFNMGVPIN